MVSDNEIEKQDIDEMEHDGPEPAKPFEPLDELEVVPDEASTLVALEPIEAATDSGNAPVPDGREAVDEASGDESGDAEVSPTQDTEHKPADGASNDASRSAEAEPVTENAPAAAEPKAKGPAGKHGKHAAPAGTKGNSDQFAPSADVTRPLAGLAAESTQAIPIPQPVQAAPQVTQPAGAAFVAAEFGEIPKKKRRRGLKAFGITLGVIAAVLLVAYIAGAVVFMGRMLPNTKISQTDVSLKTDAEVAAVIDGMASGYQLDVIGAGFAYRATSPDLGLSIDSQAALQSIHRDLNPWAWPMLIIGSEHDESKQINATYDRSKLETALTAEVGTFNETATPPTNATIVYDEKKSKFVVEPEKAGTQLKAEAVVEAAVQAVDKLEGKVRVTDDMRVLPTVFSNDPKLIEAAELASGMVSADLTLVMGGVPVGEVNGETLSSFITIDENLKVIFREEEMNAWVANLAAGFNTVGTERSFTRADGKQVSVPAGGVYGWEIDTEALMAAVLEGIKAGSAANIEVPCIETAAVYKGPGQRDWGNRYIDVDLSEQHVRFYGDDGAIIWEADCISGSPDGTHNTGTGTWYVNNKESPSKLIGYENGKKIYETTVTYWMAFEGNGIGFHDATWQPSFGGDMYANGYGSHGCVNLSYSDAEALYGIIQIGDPVVVHF